MSIISLTKISAFDFHAQTVEKASESKIEIGVPGYLILLIVLFTSFYNIDGMGIMQSDEITYAVSARESSDQWMWWINGGDPASFDKLIGSYGGVFNGSSFMKPLQHMALTVIGFVTSDTALGTRVWQAGFRVLVVGALLFWGPQCWGRPVSLLAALFFSFNVGSAATWRLGLAHGQSAGLILLACLFYSVACFRSVPKVWLLTGGLLMGALLSHMNTIPYLLGFVVVEGWRWWRSEPREVMPGAVYMGLGGLAVYGVSEMWHGIHFLLLPMDEINAITRNPLKSTVGQWLGMFYIATGWPESTLAQRIYMYLVVPLFAEGLPMLLLGLFGIGSTIYRPEGKIAYLLPVAICVLSLGFFLSGSRTNLELRNLAPLFPFMAFFAAVGAERLLRASRTRLFGWIWVVLALAHAVWNMVDILVVQSGHGEVARQLRNEGITQVYTNKWMPESGGDFPVKVSVFADYGLSTRNLLFVSDRLEENEALLVQKKWISERKSKALRGLMESHEHYKVQTHIPPKYIEYRAMRLIPTIILPGPLKEIQQLVMDAYESREFVVFRGPIKLTMDFRSAFTVQYP